MNRASVIQTFNSLLQSLLPSPASKYFQFVNNILIFPHRNVTICDLKINLKSARADCVYPAGECVCVCVCVLQGSILVCVNQQMNLTAEVVELLFVLGVCHVTEGDLKVRGLLSP